MLGHRRGMYFEAEGGGEGGGTADAGGPPAEGGTNQAKDWRTMMPGEFRAHESFAGYGSARDMFQAHVDVTTKLKGYEAQKDRMVIRPGDDAKPEEHEAFAKAIGRPDAPEGYELKGMSMPEGIAEDEKLIDWFSKTAHEVGMPKAAARKLVERYNEMLSTELKASDEARNKVREEAKSHLKQTWGDKAPENLEKVKRLVVKFAGEEGLKRLVELGVGDDPGFLKFLLAVGAPHFEDSAFEGGKFSSANRGGGNTDKHGIERVNGIPVFPKHKAGAGAG